MKKNELRQMRLNFTQWKLFMLMQISNEHRCIENLNFSYNQVHFILKSKSILTQKLFFFLSKFSSVVTLKRIQTAGYFRQLHLRILDIFEMTKKMQLLLLFVMFEILIMSYIWSDRKILKIAVVRTVNVEPRSQAIPADGKKLN